MLKIGIIGRSNVGKSALFNRLLKNNFSIIDDAKNTTRNNLVGYFDNSNFSFCLIDTGGLTKDENLYYELIFNQIRTASKEWDAILFVVDFNTGCLDEDLQISRIVHKFKKPVLLCINKYDKYAEEDFSFANLGFKNQSLISTLHAINIDKVYDFIYEQYQAKEKSASEEPTSLKFCFLGLPNAGKSSLFNLFLNESRSIVSHIPQTTRNVVSDIFLYKNKKYELVDTAGFLRQSKLKSLPLQLYKRQSLQSLQNSDIVLYTVDCTTPITNASLKLASAIKKNAKPIIVLANKIDLITDPKFKNNFIRELKQNLHFISIYKIIFVSAETGYNLKTFLDQIDTLSEKLDLKFSLQFLNLILNQSSLILKLQNFSSKGISFKYISQNYNQRLSFNVRVKNLTALNENHKKHFHRFFSNALGINNLPIKIKYLPWKT